jgi:competence protein ComEC
MIGRMAAAGVRVRACLARLWDRWRRRLSGTWALLSAAGSWWLARLWLRCRSLPLREEPLPSRPLVVVAACLVAGCVAASDTVAAAVTAHGWTAAAWLAGVVLLAGWRAATTRDRPAVAAALLCLAIACCGAAWSGARGGLFAADDLAWHLATTPRPVAVRGVVLESPVGIAPPTDDPRVAAALGPSSRCVLRVTAVRAGACWRPASGRATVVVGAAPEDVDALDAGGTVEVLGRGLRPSPALNPGEFDAARRARGDRCLSLVRVRRPADVRLLEPPAAWSPAVWLDRLRRGGATALRGALSPARAALADALLLGNRAQLPRDAAEGFLVTGTVHILSISGLHVSLIAAGLFQVLRWLPVPRTVALATVAACTGLYMLMVRAETPVVRATLLVWLACGAAALGRRPASLTGLAFAAVCVLVRDPADAVEVGPQLSFLATAVLVGMASLEHERRRLPVDPIERLIDRSRPPWWRWLRRRLGAVVTLFVAGAAVWLVTAPLVAARFHIVTPVALVLNVVIAPLVALAMVAGFLCIATAPVSTVAAGWAGAACDATLACLEWCIAWGAAVPGGHAWVAGPPAWWVTGWYAGLVAALCLLPASRLRRPTVWVGIAAAWCAIGVAGTAATRLAWPAAPELRVVIAAMGHGCGIVVRAPGGRTLLYDAGRLGAPAAARRAIAGVLWSEGLTRIDTLVVSHADADHYNAIPDLLDRFTIGEIVVPEPFLASPAASAAGLLRRARQRHVPVRVARTGDSFALSPMCRVRVLQPPPAPGGRPATDNESSLVLAVESAGRRLLLTGDIEGDTLRRFVAADPGACDVLVAPHHGSRTSLPADIARATVPSWVVVSGAGGTAWAEVAEAYRRAAAGGRAGGPATVVKTGDEGAVALTLTAAGVTAARWAGRWRPVGGPGPRGPGPAAAVSDHGHAVLEPPDAVHLDDHAVVRGERERLVGHDAGAGQEDDTVRKRL